MGKTDNEKKKIVLIGAGSAMFSRGLITDLIRHPEMGPWKLGLIDIDVEALEAISSVAGKMVDAKDADIEIEASTERKDILPGADVVVSTIGVGSRRAWEADVFIPRKYGVYQPVGDTAMAGGISRALRMIPAMVEIAEDVSAICPDALFFNYANPMTACCRAVNKATSADMTGLCVGVKETISYLNEIAGLPSEEVNCLWAGVNHFTLIYDYRHQGQDARQIFKKKLAEADSSSAEAPGQIFREMGDEVETRTVKENPFSWQIFESFGAYPAVNDRHVIEFFPEQFIDGKYQGHTLGKDTYSIENTIEYGDQLYKEIVSEGLKEGPLSEGFFEKSAGEHEQLLEILDSLFADRRRIYSINTENNGIVSNLPDNAVLEVPAVAAGRGFMPLRQELPDHLAAIINKKLGSIELTVEAALKGDRTLVVEAMLADGCLNDRGKVEEMVDELLSTHSEYLPQFE